MSSEAADVRIFAVIPAAGMSRRFGRPKQSLPFRGTTFAASITQTLLAAGADGVMVVTRTDLLGVLDLPDDPRVHIAINDDSDSEMIDSIRIGMIEIDAIAAPAPRGILIVPVDMPAISQPTCRACIEAFVANPEKIVIACHGDRTGHPIVFPFTMRAEVDQLEGGLRTLPERHADRVLRVQTEEPAVLTDIDTPDDYENLNNAKM